MSDCRRLFLLTLRLMVQSIELQSVGATSSDAVGGGLPCVSLDGLGRPTCFGEPVSAEWIAIRLCESSRRRETLGELHSLVAFERARVVELPNPDCGSARMLMPEVIAGRTTCARRLYGVGEAAPLRSHRQKFVSRSGASSVYRTVCCMFSWPSQACSARVSRPAFAPA
jgi:hypothetical protein